MADATQIRITAVDQTAAAFRSVQGNISSLQNTLRGIAGPLAAAFSVAAIGTFAKSLVNAADRLQDVSEQTGIAVSTLSALGNAAQLNGSNADSLNTALVKLNRSISDAAGGSKEQMEAFKAVGITLEDLQGLSPEQVFLRISDAFAGTENGANKTAIAMALLGRSGAELIPVLNQGSDELLKYSATFSEDFAKASGNFNDNLDKVIINIKRVSSEALTPVLEGLNEFFKQLEAINTVRKKENKGFWSTLFGLTEIGEFLGYGIGDKVTAEIKKIESAQVKASQTVKKATLPPIGGKADMSPIQELVDRNKELVDIYNKTRQPVDILNDGLTRLNQLYDQGFISLDQYLNAQMQLQEAFQNTVPKIELNDTALRKYSASTRNLQDALQSAAVNGLRSLEDALIGVYTGTMTVKDAFKSMAISIIQDLIRIQIQRSITGPIADALSGLFSVGNTTSGAPLGSGISLPGRAMGGTVQAGGAYMVGERGPEMFIPGRTGSIVPNDQIGGGGPVVNQTLQISVGVSQTVRAEVMNMLPRIMEATKAAVADSKRRGGTFGKMMSA